MMTSMDDAQRPGLRSGHTTDPDPAAARRVAVVTGTRAEFGLLTPVMRAIDAHPNLELLTFVSGTHLLPPAYTRTEVEARFRIDAEIPMQREGETGRLADAATLGRGVEGVARAIRDTRPDWVIVLGDRIEALAGAAAASVAGVLVGHVHGGDRAEGIADEAIRHAITKLAHLHFPATRASAERIEKMGEDAWRIHTVGSPAIDGLADVAPLDDETFGSLGSPRAVLLMHPEDDDPHDNFAAASNLLRCLAERFGEHVLCLHPNFDAGREGVLDAIEAGADRYGVRVREHLERTLFVALLRRLAGGGGILAGNSSAGLIEAAALRLPALDVGRRQSGRERPGNVVHCAGPDDPGPALDAALEMDRNAIIHPYGDGRAGQRIANLVSETTDRARLLRKRCTY